MRGSLRFADLGFPTDGDPPPAPWRLHDQRLDGPPLAGPAEVVGWLVAVQSQDFAPALWSLAQRCDGLNATAARAAFDGGEVVRTHVLRPTWHFVAPGDIRWLLELTGPRVDVTNGTMYRRLGLDETTRGKATEVIVAALEGGRTLTRAQLGDELERHGIATATPEPLRLAYLLMHAELEGVVCSGPMDGKQHTYALLDERVPAARPRSRDEALAELTRRFVTSRGPVTVEDLKRWSSLTVRDVRAGFEMVADSLHREEVDGTTYWFAEPVTAAPAATPRVHLLQGYDEYLSSYPVTRHVHDPSAVVGADRPGLPIGVVICDGEVVGRWRRSQRAAVVDIEVLTYVDLDAAQRDAVQAAADRLGTHLGVAAEVTVRPLIR